MIDLKIVNKNKNVVSSITNLLVVAFSSTSCFFIRWAYIYIYTSLDEWLSRIQPNIRAHIFIEKDNIHQFLRR